MVDHFSAVAGSRRQKERPAQAGRSQGAQRHLLCVAHGHAMARTVYNRFNRWAKAGIWLRIFEVLAARSPQSLQLIDSSIIRAHQHAAGGKKGVRITPSAVLVED
jgi:transposase